MPTVPRAIKCKELGCTNERAKLSSSCVEHGGRNTYTLPSSAERKEFNKAYDSAWRRVRAAQLSKQPLCQGCLSIGHIKSARQVDHLFAWMAIGKEAFNLNVFQSLCDGCHSDKTGLERKGVYRHYVGTGHTDYALSDYARVVGEALRLGDAGLHKCMG
jgi:5-methylcytosine-specific restriction endonuclease McrA